MATETESLIDLTLDGKVSEKETEALALEEGNVETDYLKYQRLISFIEGQFTRAKHRRLADENRWLDCWRNYRGIYGPKVQFRKDEQSQAFVKITKTKVLAAYAQINDILFSSAAFPIGVESSKVPTGILESVHFDPESPNPEEAGVEEDQEIFLSSSVARQDILDAVGPLKEKLSTLPEEVELKEGPGKTPTSVTWEPAKEAAREMEKRILDQLEEANAHKSVRSTLFEMCTFGSGIFKGPFAKTKEYPKWDEEGNYIPVIKTVPDVTHVSIWHAYPDPDARFMEEAEFFIERHRLNTTQLRALKKRPYFRSDTIEAALRTGENYIPEHWEHSLDDSEVTGAIQRYQVLEYWGVIDSEIAEEAGLTIPKKFKDEDQVQVNIWICNGYVLRLVMNPFTPARIPYFIVPYELNPYSIHGVGVAENMSDTQEIMNGFIRLAVDNSVLSSNVVFEVNETNLVPGQSMDIYPGKVFRTNGNLGQSIHGINIPNVAQQCVLMFDKARQLADEATGMPSYSHGQSGITGVGRTASGMSMLMGAAKENIKSVVRNIDDYLLVPLGKSLFAFNMQFDFDKKFIGDLEIVARGTESLMRNEIRSQKLLQFYQMTMNPEDAPWTKRDYLLREIAISLDLDPDKVVNDPREAAIQAELMKKIQEIQGIDPNQQGGGPQEPQGLNDPTGTGGGVVAPGMSPEPGAEGFTGNEQPQQGMM